MYLHTYTYTCTYTYILILIHVSPIDQVLSEQRRFFLNGITLEAFLFSSALFPRSSKSRYPSRQMKPRVIGSDWGCRVMETPGVPKGKMWFKLTENSGCELKQFFFHDFGAPSWVPPFPAAVIKISNFTQSVRWKGPRTGSGLDFVKISNPASHETYCTYSVNYTQLYDEWLMIESCWKSFKISCDSLESEFRIGAPTTRSLHRHHCLSLPRCVLCWTVAGRPDDEICAKGKHALLQVLLAICSVTLCQKSDRWLDIFWWDAGLSRPYYCHLGSKQFFSPCPLI